MPAPRESQSGAPFIDAAFLGHAMAIGHTEELRPGHPADVPLDRTGLLRLIRLAKRDASQHRGDAAIARHQLVPDSPASTRSMYRKVHRRTIRPRPRRWFIVLALGCLCMAPVLPAQGVTTGTITGLVASEDGAPLDGGRVRITHARTGFFVETALRQGRFAVGGLETGGPYVVEVRHPGYLPALAPPQRIALGEPFTVFLTLRRAAVRLDTIRAAMHPGESGGTLVAGLSTRFSDSTLQRLPTMNRDLYDFVALVPQVSTKIGLPNAGFSAAGSGFRYNNFLINGAPERLLGGNGSPAFAGGRSVPLDAIREYQVLIAPYDVRYGDFSGALVNSVTESGTNELRGTAFVTARSDGLARRGSASAPYERVQTGFAIGGPLVRDRAHFFIAPEIQRLSAVAAGPHLSAKAAMPDAPVTAGQIERLSSVMEQHGLVAGSAERVRNRHPLDNAFVRVDVALPSVGGRLALWHNYGRSESAMFSRASPDTFSLSGAQAALVVEGQLTSAQLHSRAPFISDAQNELVVAFRTDRGVWRSPVAQPVVQVSVPRPDGGLVTLNTGSHPVAHGMRNRLRTFSARNTLMLPRGQHLLTAGAEVERFGIERGGVLGGYGTWSFSSIDSLEQGLAAAYELRRDFGSATTPLHGTQVAAFIGDRWTVSDRLAVTAGVRGDLLSIDGRPPYNRTIDSLFQRRTDDRLARSVHLSPRLGVSWDLTENRVHQLRGGIGLFTGRPPLAWIHSTHSNHGTGIGVVRCAGPGTQGAPPPFTPDHLAPPVACAGQLANSNPPAGDVELLRPGLRLVQAMRTSLGYDARLTRGLAVGLDALITRQLSDIAIVNLNLLEPVGEDLHGRTLYGTHNASGQSIPNRRWNAANVLDLRNTSRNRATQLTARLRQSLLHGSGASASYTWSRVRDVQTPIRVNTPGLQTWGSARAYSGRHDDLTATASSNEIPHRVVLAGVFAAPWRHWGTELALSYVGEAGRPFTYLAGGVNRRGDLNADGFNANDPIYVPRDARDASEIRFSGLAEAPGADDSPAAELQRMQAQAEALNTFVAAVPCLREQRGRIMARNSCREPWSHTTIASLRQQVVLGSRPLELQLDVFNVLNLLSPRWGHYRVASPLLLEHVGHTTGSAPQPVFRFTPDRARWLIQPVESSYQLQLGVRYRFAESSQSPAGSQRLRNASKRGWEWSSSNSGSITS